MIKLNTMKLTKLNHYTWVVGSGKNIANKQFQSSAEETTFRTERQNKKKRYNKQEQENIYRKFCREIFRDRKFISRSEFHRLIMVRFNTNTTFYRNRMKVLGYITEKNALIQPTENLFIPKKQKNATNI